VRAEAPKPVEEVRERLRQLGYLDSGLDRFVLADAASAVSPLRASWSAAVRVGVAGGLLLGVTLALGAAMLDPRLRAAPADLAVLAAYLVALAAVVLGAVAFAAGLLVARAGRVRVPSADLARNVGLGLALAALAYLALWWRSHAIAAPAPVQALAAVVALGLALALARFGSLAAVAVLSAGGGSDRLPRAPLSRHHVVRLLALSVVLFAAGLAVLASAGKTQATPAAEFVVIPTGARVRVIGIDGLSFALAERAMHDGSMPRLAALVARSAHARLRAEPEPVPALVWTTIATGRGPEAHGIVSTGARRIAGMRTPMDVDEGNRLLRAVTAATDVLRLTRRTPATSALRAVKTFWNVASEKGLRVGVVNWWATWPADAVNGYVVSDRAFFKLERGEAPDRDTYPPEAFASLKPLAALPVADPRPEVRRARAIDAFYARASAQLRGRKPPDVDALYLPGLDIATMQLLGDTAGLDVATLGERVTAVRAYCAWLDEVLDELVRETPLGDALVIVADPGRQARGTPGESGGLLILSGAPFAAGDLGVVGERDVAPTIAHLSGLAVSAELEGRVLESALAPPFRTAHPVRRVAIWGTRATPRAPESAFDREMLEELRSLGYIQ
jgi:hypothetical protein